MPFSATDQISILQAVGEDVSVLLNGVVVDTIRAKFRRDVEVINSYSAGMIDYKPGILISSADAATLTSAHGIRRSGTDYDQLGAPQEQNDGFVRIILQKTKAPQQLVEEGTGEHLVEEGPGENLTT